jgi:hypothetical protein
VFPVGYEMNSHIYLRKEIQSLKVKLVIPDAFLLLIYVLRCNISRRLL